MLLRTFAAVDQPIGIGAPIAVDHLGMLLRQLAPVGSNDVEDDPVEPRLDRRAALELVLPSEGDHEDLLHDVVQVGLWRSEAPGGPPDEGEVGVVDLGAPRPAARAAGDERSRRSVGPSEPTWSHRRNFPDPVRSVARGPWRREELDWEPCTRRTCPRTPGQ